ncbi:MAG: glycosyltransferase, partial [Proteobacteria bacterium]|nr:glycosyltransferase [Pseudomonadota bacterium]
MTVNPPQTNPSQAAAPGAKYNPRDICIVLPTYNEAENIEPMVSSLLGLVPQVRVHVVDDAS